MNFIDDTILSNLMFNAFRGFCDTVLTDYNVKLEERVIQSYWDKFNDLPNEREVKKINERAKPDEEDQLEERNKAEPEGDLIGTSSSLSKPKNYCQHIFLKGPRAKTGEPCNNPICKKSMKYCRSHVKDEELVETKEIPTTLKTVKKKLLYKSVYGNFIDTFTKFIFDPETKTVIGKEGDKGAVLGLSNEDLETSKKLKYKLNNDCKLEFTI